MFGIGRFLPIERGPQVNGLPHFDPLLQLRLLERNPDAVLQLVDLTMGIKTQNRDDAPKGLRPSMHSMVVVFPAPLGPIKPKISPSLTSNDTSSTATVRP
jgi:hypothetical protein